MNGPTYLDVQGLTDITDELSVQRESMPHCVPVFITKAETYMSYTITFVLGFERLDTTKTKMTY